MAAPPTITLTLLSLLLPLLPTDAQVRNSEREPTTTLRPPTIAAIALSIRSRAIQDSRCYLMDGGAVESFFVSEDTPVGSIIGTLSVNGDPSDDGDITLTLQEKRPAVAIAPGSKNLTLLRALDREERLGPSNVYVNVRCDRRRTTDPTFIIPVSVRVWDVNDNAPEWLGTPYRVRLSELTAAASRVLPALRARDADQPGPHATIHYSVLPGPNSEYFGFVNELDSVLMVKKPLDYETLSKFNITLRAQDGGRPPLHNDTTVEVEVLDADDQNPKFSHDHYTATLPNDAQQGTILETSPGPISAKDQDVGINAPLHYSTTGDKKDLVLVDRDTGRVAVTSALLTQMDNPITIVLKATQVDNADRYALATLSISRRSAAVMRADGARVDASTGGIRRPVSTVGTDTVDEASIADGTDVTTGSDNVVGSTSTVDSGVRFSSKQFSARVPEDAAPGTVITTLTTGSSPTPTVSRPHLQFYVSERSFLEKFAINSLGEVILRRPLDYEETDSYHYQVMVTDGRANDTAAVDITVMNVNEWEPRFRYPRYEFQLREDTGGALVSVGRVHVFDGDRGDVVTLMLEGPDASKLYIDNTGEVFVRSAPLTALNSSALHARVAARDAGHPPKQSSVPVIVHVSEQLLAGSGAGAGGGVLAVFGGALAGLALLVVGLLLYICRTKRAKSSASSNNNKSSGFVNHEKAGPAQGLSAVGDAAGSGVSALVAGGGGSLQSVSAGASTILANSSSSLDLRAAGEFGTTSKSAGRQSQRFPKSKIAPAPPAGVTGMTGLAGAAGLTGVSAASDVAQMSDHLRTRTAGSRSGVAWPAATIPARVKKLSWDDNHPPQPNHNTGNKGSGEGEPQVHDATNPALHDNMNLTVYF